MKSKNKPKIEIYEKKVAQKASELAVADELCYKCTIIAHLNQYTTIPTFSYIEVSMLVCKLCY